ncbi:hypothetical protein Tco_0502412 [Tanacetum coccineum]
MYVEVTTIVLSLGLMRRRSKKEWEEVKEERINHLKTRSRYVSDQDMCFRMKGRRENNRSEKIHGKSVVVLTRWIEKMEFVQDMSGCSIDQKVKYTTGSLVSKALTWWNSQICTLSQEVAVIVKSRYGRAGHAAYTDRFHELARLVPHLVTLESRKIERYVYGLALQIRRMVAATEPKIMQKAVQISGALTDETVRNGSIKKVEKRGNMGEPSKDKNGRDDNKRNRTGNAFATTANPVGRENMGAWPKHGYTVSSLIDTAYWSSE